MRRTSLPTAAASSSLDEQSGDYGRGSKAAGEDAGGGSICRVM
jgi:hypothetical protein